MAQQEASEEGPQDAAPAPVQVETVYVNFTANVDDASTEGLLALLARCHEAKAQTLHLMLATSGGSVMCGMAIYNMLRAYPFRVVTWNLGNVDSIGNIIYLAGDERYAAPHSTFMFHSVSFNAPAAERQELPLLRERLSSIEADNKRLSGIVAERTNLSEEAAAALYGEAKTVDTAEAVGFGLVHEVRQPSIPADAIVVNLSFPRG